MSFKSSGSKIKSFFMLRRLRVFVKRFFTISVAVFGHKSHGKLHVILYTNPLLYLSKTRLLKICSRTLVKLRIGTTKRS